MINRILSAVDKKLIKETFAVLANIIDWRKAFPRQCPKLVVQSFFEEWGLSIINSSNYKVFSEQTSIVKWHGCQSTNIYLNGGGLAGSTKGLLKQGKSNQC